MNSAKLTLGKLAESRGLDPEWLKSFGWKDTHDGVAIPWPSTGVATPWHIKTNQGWRWKNYNKESLLPYGLDLVKKLNSGEERLVIVESETDCMALLSVGIPAIAAGGASHWKDRWGELICNYKKIVVWWEDQGSTSLAKSLASSSKLARQLLLSHNLPAGANQKDAGRILAALGRPQGAQKLREIVGSAYPLEIVSPEDLIESIAQRLDKVSKPDPDGDRMALCPFHNDHTPSLGFGPKGFNCFGCGFHGSLELLGLALGLLLKASNKPKGLVAKATSEAVDLRTLLNAPEEKVSWVVEELLPAGGLSVLAGRPKVGKSTLARQMLLAIAQGNPVLDRKTHQGTVLYLPLEEKRSELKRHFQQMGANGEEPVVVLNPPSRKDLIPFLERNIRRYRPILVVVDPLFMLARVKDINDYAQVLGTLEPLIKIARSHGCHILCVHHMNKVGSGQEGILGSTAIAGAVDTILLLTRTEGGKRFLSSTQRYGQDLPETLLSFNLSSRSCELGKTRDDYEMEKIEEEILEFVKERGETTEQEILQAIVGREARIKMALRRLFKERQLERRGEGKRGNPYRYALPSCYQESGKNPEIQKQEETLTQQKLHKGTQGEAYWEALLAEPPPPEAFCEEEDVDCPIHYSRQPWGFEPEDEGYWKSLLSDIPPPEAFKGQLIEFQPRRPSQMIRLVI